MERSILDRKIGPIPTSGLGPDGKLKLESEEEPGYDSNQRGVDFAKSPRFLTAPMIPLTRNGCERSMNSVRIDRFSRDPTESCGSLYCLIRAHLATRVDAVEHAWVTSAASGLTDYWHGGWTSLFRRSQTTKSVAN